MEDEKLCLKWNDFQENVISSFGTLREDSEFADVTLACEDGHQVEAHKIILASSSPFFLNLLKRNKHPHPLIYMRGVNSKELVAMIDFLYHGEANVYQDNLDDFLAVAKELQLKGLMGSDVEKEQEEDTIYNKPISKKKATQLPQPESYTKKEVVTPNIDIFLDKVETGTVAVTEYSVSAELKDLDDTIKSMMIESENMTSNHGRARICQMCGKEGTRHNIRDHIEANHITGVSHTCNICGKVVRSRKALSSHKSTYHRSQKDCEIDERLSGQEKHYQAISPLIIDHKKIVK